MIDKNLFPKEYEVIERVKAFSRFYEKERKKASEEKRKRIAEAKKKYPV